MPSRKRRETHFGEGVASPALPFGYVIAPQVYSSGAPGRALGIAESPFSTRKDYFLIPGSP